jgi:hypothetical protein
MAVKNIEKSDVTFCYTMAGNAGHKMPVERIKGLLPAKQRVWHPGNGLLLFAILFPLKDDCEL